MIPTFKETKTLLLQRLSPIAQPFPEAFAVQKRIQEKLPDEGVQTVASGTATIPHNRQVIVGQGASPPTGQPVCAHPVHDWGWLIISVNCMSVFQQADCTEHGLIPFSQ